MASIPELRAAVAQAKEPILDIEAMLAVTIQRAAEDLPLQTMIDRIEEASQAHYNILDQFDSGSIMSATNNLGEAKYILEEAQQAAAALLLALNGVKRALNNAVADDDRFIEGIAGL
jgi:hypothetical protein